ncbi:Smr domain containing protein C11H11,03c [Ceratobasidium theobromae]|uniref:Smr domain containing protein C11H11,03c n=1 Tax=Ceratobasidium theobromae TaxID=1582974 RepID=A0A5N5QH23_9AGAM|nr:Smr domain containing protein C11H11,03c [Ceratobasidium theobromae]
MEQAQENPYYEQLREQARHQGEAMAKAFADSQAAYVGGERAKAKEQLNDSDSGELDLHGLYVNEAVKRAEVAIHAAQRRGDEQIRIVVGRGLHSLGNAARIKPAIEQLLARYRLDSYVDPYNEGVLVALIGGYGIH